MENQNSLPVLPKKNFKNTKGKKRPEKGTKRLKLKKKKEYRDSMASDLSTPI
jgi:hypothetical protein